MLYELPPGKRSAQEIDFTGAVNIPKNQIRLKGSPIPMGRNYPQALLGVKSRQFSSGKNGNMNAHWRKRLGPDWEQRNRQRNRRWTRVGG